jgi:hypothetical protein
MNDGAGKIYIKFERSESARRCIEAITQRLYSGREVYASQYSEHNWNDRIFE